MDHLPQESKELAYIVGVYLGDGSVCKHKNGFYRFVLGVIDKEFVDEVARILLGFGYKTLRHEYQSKHKNRKRMFFVTIHNTEFALWLKKSTRNKSVLPLWILKNDEFFIEFVNGLLDSEGWVGKTKVADTNSGYKYSVGINMTSHWLPKLVKHMSEYGVKVGKCYKPKKEKPHYKQKLWFQFNVQSFIDSPFRFRIQRKQERLNEYRATKLNRDSNYFSQLGKRGASIRWEKRIKVNSVEA